MWLAWTFDIKNKHTYKNCILSFYTRISTSGSPWGCSVCKRKLGVLAVQKIVKEVIDQIGDKRNSSNEELNSLILEVLSNINMYMVLEFIYKLWQFLAVLFILEVGHNNLLDKNILG